MCKDSKKYTIKQFREDYPDENACLDKVFKLTYGNLSECPKCNSSVTYRKVPTRRSYQCPKCYNQLYPTAGTVFEKTRTPLTYWFYAIFLFTASKNGISAMELMRQIGVTYKTAWRMLKHIRLLIKEDGTVLSGVIEADETFVGGKNKNRHKDKRVEKCQGRSFKDKVPVMGMYSDGRVKAYVVEDTKANSLHPVLFKHVERGSILTTDEWLGYKGLFYAYERAIVDHRRGMYVNDEGFTTNRIENFWSVLKRTINGSYIHVSKKYLQLYVNECSFRFNNKDNKAIFHTMLNYLSS